MDGQFGKIIIASCEDTILVRIHSKVLENCHLYIFEVLVQKPTAILDCHFGESDLNARVDFNLLVKT